MYQKVTIDELTDRYGTFVQTNAKLDDTGIPVRKFTGDIEWKPDTPLASGRHW